MADDETEEEPDDDPPPAVTRSRAASGGISLWGVSVSKHKPPGLRNVVPVGSPPGYTIQWVRCDDCHRWVTVESPVVDLSPSQNWTCKENTWNPKLASCFTGSDFETAYTEWWVNTISSIRPAVLHGTIRGKVVNFWCIYNSVTQLGGLSTVSANDWYHHIIPDHINQTASATRQLSTLYMRYLYDFECANFLGKRYETVSDGLALLSPKPKRRRVDHPQTHPQMVFSSGRSPYVTCGAKAT